MNTKKMEMRLNANFGAMQSFYWMSHSSMSGFASVFLLSVDFDNRQIGVVLALANIFAMILQPFVAALADSSQKVTVKQLLLMISFVCMSLSVVLLFTPKVFIVLASLFVLILTSMYIIQPLISGFVFEFINRGIPVNFGITRGIGSVSYAVISYILGRCVERFGPACLPYVSLMLVVLYTFTILITTDSHKISATATRKQPKKEEASTTTLAFIKENKTFLGYLAGVVFLFACHNMFNNYLIHIVERIGGSSTQMGTAIFIAAILELPVMGMFTYLLHKFSVQSLLRFAAVFFIVKAVAAFISTTMGMLYVAQILQMPSYALFIPASVYYVNVIMKKSDRIKGQAYTTSAMTGGAVIGNLTGGVCLDLLGVNSLLIACIIVSVIGMMCIIIFTKKKGDATYENA